MAFSEDIPTQKQLRKAVQGAIGQKTSQDVSAGNRVIDQGEKVTTRHLAMLQAMKQTLEKAAIHCNQALS